MALLSENHTERCSLRDRESDRGGRKRGQEGEGRESMRSPLCPHIFLSFSLITLGRRDAMLNYSPKTKDR